MFSKIKRTKIVIQDDLGPVLERSWAVLGRHLGWKNVWNRWFQVVSWTSTFSKIRRFEDGSGANLGRKRRQHDRKWSPRGTQDRPQNDPRQAQDGSKRVLKAFLFYVEFCVQFWSVLGSILELPGHSKITFFKSFKLGARWVVGSTLRSKLHWLQVRGLRRHHVRRGEENDSDAEHENRNQGHSLAEQPWCTATA